MQYRKTIISVIFLGMMLSGCDKEEEAQTVVAKPGQEGKAVYKDRETQELYQNWQELKKRGLRLLPVPKQLVFSDSTVKLSGKDAREVVIVLAEESESGKIAADEIVSRIDDFSGKVTIPVVRERRPGAYNIVIEAISPNTFTRDKTRHPEAEKTDQAYGLYPAADGITLAGQGEIGLLYAAVTFRYLLAETGDGVVLYPAKVIDWPDYKNRQMGTLYAPYHNMSRSDPEAHYKNMRKYIDWLFRMKATGTFRHTLGSQHHSSLPDNVVGSPELSACAKRINEYAKARGFLVMHNGSVRLGTTPEDKDRPGFDKMMLDKQRGHYHSWARHDLHRNKARNMAEFCKRGGFSQVFIHAVDSGGILDPELWSHRDELTRQKYGDDRIQADADMFNIYAQELKENGNGAELVIVAYPYTASYLDETYVREKLGMADTPEARAQAARLVADLHKWMAGVNKKIPLDVRMCIREDSRANMFKYYAAYDKRPMWIYWEITHYVKSIYPLMTTNLRCMGSGYSPLRPHEDMLWMNEIDYVWFNEQIKAGACEYAWNTRFPGWKDYDPEYMEGGEYAVDDQGDLDIVSERAAVGMFGAKAGEYMKKVFASHLSWRVAIDPQKATFRLNTKILPELIRKNRDAVQQSCEALDRLWEKQKEAKAAGKNLMDGFSYPFFVQFYAMTKAAKAYADAHYRLDKISDFIHAGDMSQANEEISRGCRELTENRQNYDKMLTELKDEPWVFGAAQLEDRLVKKYVEGVLIKPDFQALEDKFSEIAGKKETLYEQYNVPGAFKKWLERREMVAARTAEPIVLDGELSEAAWESTPPIDQFVGHKQFKVMQMPCEARMLYDDNNLYVAARMEQPLIGEITEDKRPGSSYKFTEQVEILLVPGKQGQTDQYQLVVDTAGNVFAWRKMLEQMKGAQEDIGWKTSAKVAVKKQAGGWSFELALPLADINRRPEGRWYACIVRDHISSLNPRTVDAYASSFFSGESFLYPAAYSTLSFSHKPLPQVDYIPGLHIEDAAMQTRTTGQGAGSEISAMAAVETRHPLKDVILIAEVLDRDGNRLARQEILKKDYVALKCRTTKPFLMQLDKEYEGVKLMVTMTWRNLGGREMKESQTVVLGAVEAALGREQLFLKTGDNEMIGAAAPFNFPAKIDEVDLFSLKRGAVEFWWNPELNVRQPPEKWGEEEYECLLHYGPLPEGANRRMASNCLTVMHEKKGWIGFSINNRDGDRRLVHSPLPDWQAGEWHHVACAWDLDNKGKASLALFLDGVKMSKNIWGRKGGVEDLAAMAVADIPAAMQVWAQNDGKKAASGSVGLLRVWNYERYKSDFVPEQKLPEDLAEGELRFDFKNGLAGNYLSGERRGSLQARFGSQMP
jgi:hypothetical protein